MPKYGVVMNRTITEVCTVYVEAKNVDGIGEQLANLLYADELAPTLIWERKPWEIDEDVSNFHVDFDHLVDSTVVTGTEPLTPPARVPTTSFPWTGKPMTPELLAVFGHPGVPKGIIAHHSDGVIEVGYEDGSRVNFVPTRTIMAP